MKYSSRIFFFILLVSSLDGAYAGRRRDLSNGVVFPSSNSAVYENPAALPWVAPDSAMVDLAAYLDSGGAIVGGRGGLAKAKDYLGYGITYERRSAGGDSDVATASFGVKAGHAFTGGLGVAYEPTQKQYRLPVGLWMSLPGELKFAVSFSDMLSLYDGALGIARTIGGGGAIELDALFVRPSGSWNPSGLDLRPSFVFTASKKFSLKVAYTGTVYPENNFANGYLSLGLTYWFGESAGLQGGWQDLTSAKYVAGLKLGKD